MKQDANTYPHINEWIDGWGWIEIGYDEGPLGFVRAIGPGGLIWESGSQKYEGLDDALRDLEQALAEHLEERR
jgi:hypothetical protein